MMNTSLICKFVVCFFLYVFVSVIGSLSASQPQYSTFLRICQYFMAKFGVLKDNINQRAKKLCKIHNKILHLAVGDQKSETGDV